MSHFMFATGSPVLFTRYFNYLPFLLSSVAPLPDIDVANAFVGKSWSYPTALHVCTIVPLCIFSCLYLVQTKSDVYSFFILCLLFAPALLYHPVFAVSILFSFSSEGSTFCFIQQYSIDSYNNSSNNNNDNNNGS